VGAILFGILLLSRLFGGDVKEFIPEGTKPVVLVTVIDAKQTDKYNQMIMDNRREYAAMHGEYLLSYKGFPNSYKDTGYATFFPKLTDYDLSNPKAPESWAKIPAMRHAITKNPHSSYFFYLDHRALITNPALSLEKHIMSKPRLESLMLLDQPVVPPDSIIKTFHNRNAEHIDLVLTQDHEGLSTASFIIRRGDWAKFFLDAWFDALYRSYNFQKAEAHALEHLVQWHGTVLTKLALVPQRTLNSYTKGEAEERYSDGDFVAHLHGCDKDDTGRSCENELTPLYEHFKSSLRSLRL